MMPFAYPSAMLLAALALPIVAFYILKVRMRRIPVSTNLFWKQIFDEKPPRSLWQNLRHLVSLLVQLLLLLLLVLAVTDPYLPWQILQARRMVIVIDPSASMQATDIAPNRFAVAKEKASAIIEGLRFRDELAIVVAGESPEVAVAMTGHIPTLKRTLNAMNVTDNPTELSKAIDLGKQLIGKHPHGQVIVFSDACTPELRREATPEDQKQTKQNEREKTAADSAASEPLQSKDSRAIEVVYRTIGTRASNVGIHQFQVRRSLIDPIGYEVLVGVKNASDRSVKCRLELSLDDSVVDVIPLELKADERWSRSIEKTSLEGGTLHAQLTRIEEAENSEGAKGASKSNLNCLSRDDDAWAILPSRTIQKVLIVSPGNLFLRKVFEANPLVQVSYAKELPSELPADTLIVLHRNTPSAIPAGNVLVVDPDQSCDLWELGESIENPIVTELDKGSSLMNHVRLDNVIMPQAKQLRFVGEARTLAGTLDKTPVYAEARRASGKCLVLSVDLDSSDLAFRTVFPIIVANALGWFAGTNGELVLAQNTGATLSVSLEPKVSSALEGRSISAKMPNQSLVQTRWNGNEGAQRSESTSGDANGSRLTVGPFDQVGLWSLVSSSKPRGQASDQAWDEVEGTHPIAVNLTSDSETDIRPSESMLEREAGAVFAANWLSRPFWFYLVGMALSLFGLEWFLYQRRIIT